MRSLTPTTKKRKKPNRISLKQYSMNHQEDIRNIISMVFPHLPECNVRTVIHCEKIWFSAIDICTILAIKNPTSTVKGLDPTNKRKFHLGKQGESWFVDEPGLYEIVLRSHKPNAKHFQNWAPREISKIPGFFENVTCKMFSIKMC